MYPQMQKCEVVCAINILSLSIFAAVDHGRGRWTRKEQTGELSCLTSKLPSQDKLEVGLHVIGLGLHRFHRLLSSLLSLFSHHIQNNRFVHPHALLPPSLKCSKPCKHSCILSRLAMRSHAALFQETKRERTTHAREIGMFGLQV